MTTTWGAAQSLALSPLTATQPLGNTATVTALLLDGARRPVANATVTFQVVNGPDAGKTGQAVTDATGQAAFTLTGTAQGAERPRGAAYSTAGRVSSTRRSRPWPGSQTQAW